MIIAIVGGGAAGAVTAISILRQPSVQPRRVVVVEPSTRLGAGVAYGTESAAHLLNVRATGMSAIADDPGHFLAWARRHGIAESGDEFVPRLHYGRYLRDTLLSAVASAPLSTTFEHWRGAVTAVRPGERGDQLTAGDRRWHRPAGRSRGPGHGQHVRATGMAAGSSRCGPRPLAAGRSRSAPRCPKRSCRRHGSDCRGRRADSAGLGLQWHGATRLDPRPLPGKPQRQAAAELAGRGCSSRRTAAHCSLAGSWHARGCRARKRLAPGRRLNSSVDGGAVARPPAQGTKTVPAPCIASVGSQPTSDGTSGGCRD